MVKHELLLGVLSDNHGEDYKEIYDELQFCDAILHAGDVGKIQIIESLENIGLPFYFAYGNNDNSAIREKGTQIQEITFDNGFRTSLIHDPGDYSEDALFNNPGNCLQNSIDFFDPHLVIFGHWHIRFLEFHSNRCYFNPGAVTKHYVRDEKPGFALLSIYGNFEKSVQTYKIEVEYVDL